ncbi:MAG: DnaA regulatory inactivator Hda [Gammaproteobacteria bacterium]
MEKTSPTRALGVVGHRQLVLPLAGVSPLCFELFHPGPNAEAIDCLERLAQAPHASSVYLWGSEAVGKSHLLHAFCRRVAECGSAPAYVPLNELAALGPGTVQGLEGADAVCVDDLHCIAGDSLWEGVLFQLYDRMQARERPLVIAADRSPRSLHMGLSDLQTRLGWGLVYQLRPLDDDGKCAMLRTRARARGLDLPEEVAAFLLRQAPRDPRSLCAVFDSLDHAAMVSQRRLTVPFVSELLKRAL